MAKNNSEFPEGTKEEDDGMTSAVVNYNEKIFLLELEESLKEMKKKKDVRNSNTERSSWRDLFNLGEE